jgi:hypothetical protein
MISLKKNVSLEVDAKTMKTLERASKSLSELASAYINAVDAEPRPIGRASSR